MKSLDIKQGDKFGRLTVIKEVEPYIPPCGKKARKFLCKCVCGKEVFVVLQNLRNNRTTSCGCYHKEKIRKYNKYDFYKDYVVGYTTKGLTFKIDYSDYEKIKDYCWYISSCGYPITEIKGKLIKQHRFILNPPKEMFVDHINHDTTDNRRNNLRICTRLENSMNKKVKGYSWDKNAKKWKVKIRVNGKQIHLGYYSNENEAKEARQKAVNKYFGEFAYRE